MDIKNVSYALFPNAIPVKVPTIADSPPTVEFKDVKEVDNGRDQDFLPQVLSAQF